MKTWIRWDGPRRTTAPRPAGDRRTLIHERLSDRCLFATLSGLVFEDSNDSLRREVSESGLEDRLVYRDLNQNGVFDGQEPWLRTDASGRFEWTDLSVGQHAVRIFDGSTTQRQTTPRNAQLLGEAINVTGLQRFSTQGAYLFGIDAQGNAKRFDASDQSEITLALPSPVNDASVLPDGRLLVLLAGGDSPAAIVDFSARTVTGTNLGAVAGQPLGRALALNSEGVGLVLPPASQNKALRYSEATNPRVSDSALDVTAATRLLMGRGGQQAILWQKTDSGVTLEVVNVANSTRVDGIGGDAVNIETILDFDEVDGVALARTRDDALVLLNLHAGNAVLSDYSGFFAGPAVLDAKRDLIATIDQQSGELLIYDWLSGRESLRSPIPGGGVRDIQLLDGGNIAALITNASVQFIRLNLPDAARAEFFATNDTRQIQFGMLVDGENTAPQVGDNLEYDMNEDGTLTILNLAAAMQAVDAEFDRLAYLLKDQPSHGTATVEPSGSLVYRPNPDFFGDDQFSVLVHDGRKGSELVTFSVTVNPVADPVSGGQIVIFPPFNPLPELVLPGTPIGTVQLLTPDPFGDFIFVFNDPRIQVAGNLLVIAPAAVFDFEQQPELRLVAQVARVDNPNDQTEVEVNLSLRDENEPIVGLLPATANVIENLPGAFIAKLSAIDPDRNNFHSFEVVSDSRFVIENDNLRLADGIVIPEGTGGEILVDIRVSDGVPEHTVIKQVSLQVRPANRPPTAIFLNSSGVRERVLGAVIGELSVADENLTDKHSYVISDPRYIVEGNKLRLIPSQFFSVENEGNTIYVEIMAIDDGTPEQSFVQSVAFEVVTNDAPYQNPTRPHDVDGNGSIEPIDALILINLLNREGAQALLDPFAEGTPFYDVNGDGLVTPLDALLIINLLNRQPVSENDAAGEPGSLEKTTSFTPIASHPSNSAQATNPHYAPLVSSPVNEGEEEEETVADLIQPLA